MNEQRPPPQSAHPLISDSMPTPTSIPSTTPKDQKSPSPTTAAAAAATKEEKNPNFPPSSPPPAPPPPPSAAPAPPSSSSSLPGSSPSSLPSTAPTAITTNSSAAAAPSTTTAPAAAKIPVRPSKIRKLSSSANDTTTKSTAATSKSTTTTTMTTRMAVRVQARPLSAEGEVAAALRHLRAADPALAPIIDAHDPPTCQSLHPPFHSLARSILYQQLAFKAAASIYSRFLSLCGGESMVVPEVVLGLSQYQLRQIGVSERKASYLYDLAHKYQTGILSDTSIVAMDDKSLFTMLTMVKGIGAWSVHMFMIFSLHRPDVLPVGDLGVRKGVQMLYRLETLPKPSQMEQLCERWRPYRSIGAWYMWRLVEAKGTPTMVSVAGVGVPGVVAMPGVVGLPTPIPPQLLPPPPPQQQQQQQSQLQQQQPHIIQPIQGFPNLGEWGLRGL